MSRSKVHLHLGALCSDSMSIVDQMDLNWESLKVHPGRYLSFINCCRPGAVLDPVPGLKSLETATKYKDKGNERYKKGEFIDALKLYNMV
jgi:hypothetical protein